MSVSSLLYILVPRGRFEPPILTEYEPQSYAYTSSATWAFFEFSILLQNKNPLGSESLFLF